MSRGQCLGLKLLRDGACAFSRPSPRASGAEDVSHRGNRTQNLRNGSGDVEPQAIVSEESKWGYASGHGVQSCAPNYSGN